MTILTHPARTRACTEADLLAAAKGEAKAKWQFAKVVASFMAQGFSSWQTQKVLKAHGYSHSATYLDEIVRTHNLLGEKLSAVEDFNMVHFATRTAWIHYLPGRGPRQAGALVVKVVSTAIEKARKSGDYGLIGDEIIKHADARTVKKVARERVENRLAEGLRAVAAAIEKETVDKRSLRSMINKAEGALAKLKESI